MTQASILTTTTDPAYELSPRGKTLLQERLARYGIVVVFIALGYFPAFYLTWSGHPSVTAEAVRTHIFAPGTFALIAIHASPWLICRGKAIPNPNRWLPILDVIYCAAVGLGYCLILNTHPSPAIAPLEGALAIATVLGLRALLVPSTGLRTALAGILLALSPTVLFFARQAHFSNEWLTVRTSGPLFMTWNLVAIALTTTASTVLYGLRRDIQKALQLGQYTLVEHLGAGGMGVVYRAKHALLRRPTAVKLLNHAKSADSGSVARFEREVQLMAELSHSNTVAIYDYGRTANGVFYYAMEYLDGVDLETLVAHDGRQPAARVIHLLRQICGSLEEAHQRGLIHRDVKPANVFLCRNRSEPDVIKVLDFGLVKDLESAGGADDPKLSVASVVIGTPLYMSPEAFTTPEKVDARSDLYSLGALAYWLLTGTAVFRGHSAMDVGIKHVHTAPESPSARLARAVAPDVEKLVLQCLAKDPAERPKSARDLRDALDACSDAGSWRLTDANDWWKTYDAKPPPPKKKDGGGDGALGTTMLRASGS